MPRLVNRVPKYRKHASGQAVVTLNGRDIYLGKYGVAASRKEYARLTTEWKSNNHTLPSAAGSDYSVADLIQAYWEFAQGHYTVQNGKANGEVWSIKLSLRVVNKLYSDKDVRQFGPLALRAVRDVMIADHDWSRKYVNAQINRIRRMFKWGVGRELVGESVWTALRAVEPLTQGKTKARESAGVTTVDDAFIDAVMPFLNRHVQAMIRIQQMTGMRPGELVILRWLDFNTSDPNLWEFRPPHHKTLHKGHERVIYLNTEAQAIIEPFRGANLAGYVFSPALAEEERRALKTAARKTPLSSGNRAGVNKTRKPRLPPGERYNVDSYRRAITRACDLANSWEKGGMIINNDERLIPRWHPHQLRHNTATRLRAEHGLEAAQVILGHKTLTATQIYAEKNVAKAKQIMTGGK